MYDFRQKQKTRKLLYSNITILTLLIVIFLLGREVWGIYQKKELAKETMERAQVRYDDLQEREEFLHGEIESLKTTSGIEEKLRERFSIAKPNEQVVMLVDTNEATTTVVEEKGFWGTIKSWFGKD